MKALIFSTLYPNAAQPRHGIFLENRVRSLVNSERVDVKVVAPVPWFPSKSTLFPKYRAYAMAPHCETRHGIRVLYPRYPVVPKLGMPVAPYLLAAASIRPLRGLIKDGYDFDFIDAYYFYPDGVAAALLGWYLNKDVIITAFGNDITLIPKHVLPRCMIQWAAKRAAAITSVCLALKNDMIDLDIPENDIEVILHGVDLDLFRPARNRQALRERLGLTRTTLLMVGHLIKRKNHALVIDALSKLPGLELLIAGDGEEERSLRELAVSLGVAERVRFLGHVEHSELPAYYGAVDILILASIREGIPNALMESIACGTPVVATTAGGIPEVVCAPEAGVLLGLRTPDALVTSVQTLLENYPDRAATRRLADA